MCVFMNSYKEWVLYKQITLTSTTWWCLHCAFFLITWLYTCHGLICVEVLPPYWRYNWQLCVCVWFHFFLLFSCFGASLLICFHIYKHISMLLYMYALCVCMHLYTDVCVYMNSYKEWVLVGQITLTSTTWWCLHCAFFLIIWLYMCHGWICAEVPPPCWQYYWQLCVCVWDFTFFFFFPVLVQVSLYVFIYI